MTDFGTTTSAPGSSASALGSSSATTTTAAPGSGLSSTTGGSALETSQGSTTIADSVVAKIAALAAREVDGVAQLGGNLAGALGSVVGRIRGGGGGNEPQTAGVGVEVGQTQAAVDLTLQVLYPASIYEVANSVRQNVIDRIQGMTGLQVVEVNIAVVDLVFPGQEQPQPEQPQPQPQPSPQGRVQ